jgi:hypothetical protein
MEQNNFDSEIVRPKFLSVLCILSFIMCGIMIILSAWGLMKSILISEEERQFIEMMRSFSPEAADQVDEARKFSLINYCAFLVFQIISLFGVIMMWKLNKRGFYVYVAAELLPYLVIVGGFLIGGMEAIKGLTYDENVEYYIYGFFAVMAVIDFVFIFLYSRNLKFLT